MANKHICSWFTAWRACPVKKRNIVLLKRQASRPDSAAAGGVRFPLNICLKVGSGGQSGLCEHGSLLGTCCFLAPRCRSLERGAQGGEEAPSCSVAIGCALPFCFRPLPLARRFSNSGGSARARSDTHFHMHARSVAGLCVRLKEPKAPTTPPPLVRGAVAYRNA